MKVYVLTEGEYSDYHIETVKLDKAEAERFVAIHPTWMIEEYDTDDVKIPDKTLYTVWADKDGICDIWEGESYGMKDYPLNTVATNARRFFSRKTFTGVMVEARDVEHAKKIASDLIAKARYTREVEEPEEPEEPYEGPTTSSSFLLVGKEITLEERKK